MKRIAHRLPEVVLRGDVTNVNAFLFGIDHGEHTVVGRDEMKSVARGQNRTARGAHARVDDHHVRLVFQ